ncbi:MAG: hypothetical protein JOY78_12905 [Pseudonocardia sp.]|nr:hypothetical protein [Pseudonocardia sp.]
MVLLAAWLAETILWVHSAIHALGAGEPGPAIRGVCAILLMILLGGMEGLEVGVIDRWRDLYPERTANDLANWLAARQLFVALIVTTATLLAEPESIPIPFTTMAITGGVVLKAFTITWTGFTVLWFWQILPKHMAAMNPDRYLQHTRSLLFPLVEIVRQIGIYKPAVWAATAVERRLDWEAEPDIEAETVARRGGSLAAGWAALVPERAPLTRRSPSDERTAGSAGS